MNNPYTTQQNQQRNCETLPAKLPEALAEADSGPRLETLICFSKCIPLGIRGQVSRFRVGMDVVKMLFSTTKAAAAAP